MNQHLKLLGLSDEAYLIGRNAIKLFRQGNPAKVFTDMSLGLVGEGIKGFAKSPTHMAGAGWMGRTAERFGRATARSVSAGWKNRGETWRVGWQYTYGAAFPFIAAMSAYHASKAPKGERAGAFTADVGGSLVGGFVGGALFGVPGALAGNLWAGPRIGNWVTNQFRGANEYTQRRNSLETSIRSWHDFGAARTMRQVAVQELSSSALNARSVLGQEAAFLHS